MYAYLPPPEPPRTVIVRDVSAFGGRNRPNGLLTKCDTLLCEDEDAERPVFLMLVYPTKP